MNGFQIYVRATADVSESPLPAVIATRSFALDQARRLSLPRPADGHVPFYAAVYGADYFSAPPVVFRNGAQLPEEVPCQVCRETVRLLGGEWTTDLGETGCYGNASYGYASHVPGHRGQRGAAYARELLGIEPETPNDDSRQEAGTSTP